MGQAGYVFKWTYGATENLDLGLHWESLSLGVRAKYAFVNGREGGWSLAGALGSGSSFGGNYYNADLTGSYLGGGWEFYGTLRLVHVKSDPVEFRNTNTGQVDLTIQVPAFNYGQVIFGTRYWFTPGWMISVEAGSLFSITSGFETNSRIFSGLALGYRFQ